MQRQLLVFTDYNLTIGGCAHGVFDELSIVDWSALLEQTADECSFRDCKSMKVNFQEFWCKV
jgi:hypothetical protein